MDRSRIIILGIGNVLMGDEGVGVHAIQRLQQEQFPPSVVLLDGGTGGFHLLSVFEEYGTMIMIDATMNGAPAGTIEILQPRFASDFPRTLSAHDIGLRDMVEAASMLGNLPNLVLITVAIDSIKPMTIHLSPLVRASLDRIPGIINEILSTHEGSDTKHNSTDGNRTGNRV
jgi:hydrogenase maturation protease